MARRKLIRRSSCTATFSATSWASSSGLRTSTMSIFTWAPPQILEMSLVMRSISDPFRPITRPGREVWRVTRTLFQARSTTTFERAANWRRPLR